MKKHRVVVAGKVHELVIGRIQDSCDIAYFDSPRSVPKDVLREALRDAEGLFSTGAIRVDDDLLRDSPKLRVVSQSSVGYDNVDVDALTRRGIPFGNTPGVLVEATADLTFGLVLCAARRIHEGFQLVTSGDWYRGTELSFGVDLFGKTMGIVGLGSIGKAVARRAQAAGMQVLYHNRRVRDDEEELKASYRSFSELLSESDFVVVLVPLSDESRGMFGDEEFSKMKKTAYFINAARGLIVDTMALYRALRDGKIAYAALDVTDPEPIPPDHPLFETQNILITPHIGSATHETRASMARLAVDNLLAGLEKKPLTTCVNESVNYRGTP